MSIVSPQDPSKGKERERERNAFDAMSLNTLDRSILEDET